MANTPVTFEQRKIFEENNPLVKNVLGGVQTFANNTSCLLYTSPSPRDRG